MDKDLPRLFIGYDSRETVGFHAFVQSLIGNSSLPVSVTAIQGTQRDGSNRFTYSRFLIPYLCNYKGYAIFCDGSDMLARTDIAELWGLRSGWHAVQVVKHDYETKHKLKYIGTELEAENEDYPRKNWSSVILWNCSHYMNRCLTPEYIAGHSGRHLHTFAWIKDERIGELPKKWNHLVGENEENEGAGIVHYTLGIPAISHYRNCEHSAEWKKAAESINYCVPSKEKENGAAQHIKEKIAA